MIEYDQLIIFQKVSNNVINDSCIGKVNFYGDLFLTGRIVPCGIING